MQPRTEHINDDELDLLTVGSSVDQSLREHLESCAECAQRLSIALAGQKVLEETRGPRVSGDNRCPPREAWWELAGSLAPNEDMMQHAAFCEKCGSELQAALACGPETTNETELPPLRLDSPVARMELAKRMAGRREAPPRKEPTPFPSNRLWMWGALAAGLALAAAGTYFSRRSSSMDRLIAQAYQEKRTTEFRLPGAGYGPLAVERGAAGKSNNTIALLKAEAKAKEELLRAPDDPIPLEHLARIELVNLDYAAALPRLKRVLDLEPENLDALSDLALAYYERGQIEDRPGDFGEAIQVLDRLLAKRVDDPVALFDRAHALEQARLFREAAASWERFLKVEPKGGWADEAREHLARIQKLLIGRTQRTKPCDTMTAAMVLEWARTGELEARLGQWEDGWACLRERALTEWLPNLRDPLNREAVRMVDAAFFKATQDTWFRDLLASSNAPLFSAASSQLAQAVAANRVVDAGKAESAARGAERDFRAIGNKAGAAQAEIEYDYAIRRAQSPAECRVVLDRLEKELVGKTWTWASIQAGLEKHSCLGMSGDRAGARRLIAEISARTGKPALSSLHLRAVSYMVGADRIMADYGAMWKEGEDGLREFWLNDEAPVWAYQLYYHLAMGAAARGRADLALHLHRETLAEIQLAGRPSMEAMEWFDTGRAAMLAGATPEARQALSNASKGFQALPKDRASQATRVDCEIYLAELDNHDGRPQDAIKRLESVGPEMMQKDNSRTMQLRFARELTRADRLLGRQDRAERDLTEWTSLTGKSHGMFTTFAQEARWSRDNGDAYRQYAAFLALDKHQVESGLDLWERFRSPAPRTNRPGNENPSSLEQFSRAGIRQALVYVALEDRLLIWRLRDGAVALHTVTVPKVRLAVLSRRLYSLCSTKDSSLAKLRDASRELAAIVLSPVEAELSPKEPLWIEADDVLEGVPFPVLAMQSGETLGEKFVTISFPGIGYLDRITPPARVEAGNALFAVGVSTVPGLEGLGLAPLPGAVMEAQQTAARFASARAWSGGEVNLENVRRELPRASVFHFAGHAVNTADRTELLLPGTGGAERLDAEMLATLDLQKCRLAVISACSAEAPEFFEESRPYGFAKALLRAGAASVLTTRWNLDSTTGLHYMETFYERLMSGQPVAAAAQAAAAQIRETTGTGHPYYWAAYQLYGWS